MSFYTNFPLYPTETFSNTDYPAQADDTDTVYAALINALKTEIQACFNELGLLPKGKYTDVSARLKAISIAAGMCVPSPISQWKLNDNLLTAVILDAVGSNNGKYKDAAGDINTSTGSVTGKINEAINFDGTDQYAQIPDSADLEFPSGTNFALAVWVNVTGSSSGTRTAIVGKGYHDTSVNLPVYMLQYDPADSHRATFYLRNSSDVTKVVVGATSLNDGWHHVVGVKDGEEMRLYVDGVSDNTAVDIGGDYAYGVNSDDVYIGQHYNRYINGAIDDLRIYNIALTLAQIEAIYNSGNGTEDENPNI